MSSNHRRKRGSRVKTWPVLVTAEDRSEGTFTGVDRTREPFWGAFARGATRRPAARSARAVLAGSAAASDCVRSQPRSATVRVGSTAAVACGQNVGERVVRVAPRRSAQLPSLTTCVGGFLPRARACSLGPHAARASKLDDQGRFKTRLRIQSRSCRSRQRVGALAPRGSARPALLDTLLDRRIR